MLQSLQRLSARVGRRRLAALCCVVIIIVWSLHKTTEKNTVDISRSNSIATRKAREVKTVLVWRHPWGSLTEGVQDGSQVDNCYFTYDRNAIHDASAVIFHYTSLDEESMPWKHYRDSEQFFVYFSLESPSNLRNVERVSLSNFDNGFINWTMTYRLDSDVYYPYLDLFQNILFNAQERLDRVLPMKNEVALWVVSNCGTSTAAKARMKLVEELVEAGLPVHRYGRCFNNKMEIDGFSPERRDTYKFYLAFESSYHCKDFITEKFWDNAIAATQVPVVWGPTKKDLEKVAPARSFIHAEDFESPKALVDYLLHLHNNEAEYRKYFDWLRKPDCRTKQLFENYKNAREVALCNKLNFDARPKIIPSISEFIYATEFDECLH